MKNLEFIEKLAKEEGVTPDELKEELLEEAIEYRQIMRSGGAVFTLPNPQIYVIEDYAAADEVIDALKEAKRKIKNVQSKVGNYSIPLGDIATFLEHRIYYDKENQREEFRNNMLADSEGMNAD